MPLFLFYAFRTKNKHYVASGYRCVLEWQGVLQFSPVLSKENFAVFRWLSRSTNKPCGKHMRTKKSSHPCGCFEFADVREGTFFFLVGGRAGVSEGGSSVKVSSKRGGSYLFVSYLRGGSHTSSKFFNEDFCDIALHFSYRLRRLERVFRCTRARNLHQDAHVI